MDDPLLEALRASKVPPPAPFWAKPPKKWTSWRVCPQCGNRATKLYHLNRGKYQCQLCWHEYDPPRKGKAA